MGIAISSLEGPNAAPFRSIVERNRLLLTARTDQANQMNKGKSIFKANAIGRDLLQQDAVLDAVQSAVTKLVMAIKTAAPRCSLIYLRLT